MIALWMLAAIAFGACAGVVALMAERLLLAMHRPTRWPWTIALAVSLAWPVISVVRPVSAPPDAVVMQSSVQVAAETDSPPSRSAAGSMTWSVSADRALLVAWAVASLLVFAQLVLGMRKLRTERRRALPATINGEQVLVTKSLGPAVLGLREPRIVVPEWLLALDESLQSLVLRHEREHCEARDTVLVWVGAIATVLMPWNAGVWWMSRRLRLAMEIDCDARTLRGESEHTTYAKLLLLIAQRQAAVRFIPMLAESSSHLSRRISAMQSKAIKHRAIKAVVLVAVAGVAVAVACSPRIAANLTAPAPAVATATASITSGVADEGPRPFLESEVTRPAYTRPATRGVGYPAELRAAGIQGEVVTQYVVDTSGAVEPGTFKVLKTDDPRLGDAVRSQLAILKYAPAERNGAKVRQLVRQPFEFLLEDGGSRVRMVNPRLFTNVMRPGTAIASTDSMTSRNLLDIDSLVAAGKVLPAQAAEFRKTIAAHNAKVAELRAQLRELAESAGVAPVITEARTGAPVPRGPQPYYDFQVTQRVTLMSGSEKPKYPDMLRSAGIEGQVMAMFVVNEDGRVDMSTFKALRSDNPAFTAAVKEAVAAMTFTPARLDGKPVRQIVQRPFAFSLSR